MNQHETVILNGIEIDRSIAPLIQRLWSVFEGLGGKY